jgi:hypothetical protein
MAKAPVDPKLEEAADMLSMMSDMCRSGGLRTPDMISQMKDMMDKVHTILGIDNEAMRSDTAPAAAAPDSQPMNPVMGGGY